MIYCVIPGFTFVHTLMSSRSKGSMLLSEFEGLWWCRVIWIMRVLLGSVV